VNDVRQWLASLGLERFAEVFEREQITHDNLRDLTDVDLKELGLPLGPRKTILSAVANLCQEKIAEPSAERVKSDLTEAPAQAERRQLTVMFCDLVGSTALSQRLDPEDLRRLIRQYQDACVGAITRFEGHVAQYLGDGVLAYFGYPVALEGGAERAIRAGLSVIERVGELSGQRDEPLRVRIGIDTGVIVIGQGEALNEQERTAIGDAPNIAARLQGLAAPGSVVISERTRQLAAGGFQFCDLGGHELKGINEAVHAWQVAGERASETRFDAATGGLAAPMVGREMELDLALHAWQQAHGGKLQVLLLCGEAGIGKSRIVRALREQLRVDGAQPWQYQCSPYFINSALYPIVAHMERALRFERDESPEVRLAKLEARVMGELGRPALEVNLIGRLFNLPVEAKYGALAMSPQKQKDETLRALAEVVQAASRRQPILVLFEDVHWADPTTLDAIDQLLKRVDTRVLVVITYRPEFKPAWIGQPHVTALTLGRLDPEQIEAVVTRVAGGKPLPKEMVAQIVAKTDGVPLFVEELTKAILESNLVDDTGERYELASALPSLAIPSSLRDSLMARLDRLAPVKEVAQIGACIGREFSDELVALVSPLPRSELTKALEQLTASELVFRRGAGRDATYVFKHALVQDAAYDSLLRSKRAELHATIAQILEQRFPETAQSEPELLATHLTAAGLADKAIPFWLQAGESSLERGAIREAASQLQNGLDILPGLGNTDTRKSLELDLRVAQAMTWTFLKGWAADELFETLTQAWTILEESRTRKHIARVLWGIWAYQLCRGEVERSLQWVDRMIKEAEEGHDEKLWFVGHWCAVIAYYSYGDFALCCCHADMICERYLPAVHGPIAEMMNYDALTVALLYRSCCEVRMGLCETGLRTLRQAREHASRLNAPLNMAYVHQLATFGHLARWDGAAAQAELDALDALARQHGLAFYEFVLVPYLRAQAHCVLGDYEASLRGYETARPAWRSIGMMLNGPEGGLYAALSQGMLGRMEEAMVEMDRALADIARPGWHEWTAASEVLRVKGWLLEQQGEPGAAESAYRDSLETARAQLARTHELRTATRYARLLQSQRRAHEAHALLAPIYAWFTEGFDTEDLKEAKALLEELAA